MTNSAIKRQQADVIKRIIDKQKGQETKEAEIAAKREAKIAKDAEIAARLKRRVVKKRTVPTTPIQGKDPP